MSKLLLKHSGGNGVSLNPPTSAPGSSEVAFKLPGTDGSANQLLKTDGSGNLGWADDANASRTLLSTTTLSGSSTTSSTLDLTGYHYLEGWVYDVGTTGSATNDYWLRFNGSSSANYHWLVERKDSSSNLSSNCSGSSGTSGFFINMTGVASMDNDENQCVFRIHHVDDTSLSKNFEMVSCGPFTSGGSTGYIVLHTVGLFNETADITSVGVHCSNTMDQGTLKLWGVK